MATTAPRPGLLAPTAAPITQADAVPARPRHRRRRLDRESGQAIEILGHAIQYLADEYALECMDPALGNSGQAGVTGPNPRMQAIELLMAANRQIYMSCPQVPTLSDRLSSLFRRSSDLKEN